MIAKERLIFALDVASRRAGETLLDDGGLASGLGMLKIGLELFVAEGPGVVTLGAERKLPVFLDLKLHDIPETVERAVGRAVDLGVRFLTVHASGGPKMLERAVRRTEGSITSIVAVTVLTSLDDADLAATGVARGTAEHAALLAHAASLAGVRAFVCSPREVSALRRALPSPAAFTFITPGVRLAGAASSDQKRTATAAEAIADGADYVVVGRPIRDAAKPADVATVMVREIEEGLARRCV
ncbi:MAG: orotidine-5'-phosphate decarboxylase [Myxococcales bacterium]|nr:orotidine-5'-phosphate decarboxylase [Myxococcales bacterium]